MANKKNKFKGIFNWTFFAIAVAAVILINIVASFVNFRLDATNDKRYSLSEGTAKYLKNDEKLDNRLYIKIYLDGKLPSELSYFRDAIEDKLKEFKVYAGKKIEYEFIDPTEGTEGEQNELYENIYAKGKGIVPMDLQFKKDGQRSQMLVWPGALIEYAGSTKNVIQFLPGTPLGKPVQLENIGQTIQNSLNNLEYILMTSIRRTVEKTKPVIGILQGHGELEYSETQRARALISPYYSLRDITINDSLAAMDGVDGLIIARPTGKFSNKDLYVIDQFLMRGGKLMCFMDALTLNEDTLMATGITHTARVSTGLEKMLFDYGLKLNDNFVIDVRCAPKVVPLAKQTLIPWYYHVLATPTPHPISRNLEPVSLKYVSEIQFVGNQEIALTPVLTSSTNSTRTGMAPMISLGMPMNYGKNPKLVIDPENPANKLCLAGIAEGFFQSHFKNRIVDDFAKNPLINYKEKSEKEGKVLLVGNGNFIENAYDTMMGKNGLMFKPKEYNDLRFDPKLMEMGVEIFYGNQEFFQNAVDYMLGDNSVLDIRSKQIDIHQIDNEKVAQSASFYKWVNMLLPCLVVVLLSLVFFYIRKRKYTS
jgi:ABC-2 type transport system permease protein|tara:strand:+ start:29572 stop:31347 length:1776 start_codon:yes stop_codon:yes gene_type:complete